MLIYKIFRSDEWTALETQGETLGAPIDVQDGYVHFSTKDQVRETAQKHFKNEDGLFLLALDTDTLEPDLKWEPSRGGDLFPHLYRPLTIQDVLWVRPLARVDGRHSFPEDMT